MHAPRKFPGVNAFASDGTADKQMPEYVCTVKNTPSDLPVLHTPARRYIHVKCIDRSPPHPPRARVNADSRTCIPSSRRSAKAIRRGR